MRARVDKGSFVFTSRITAMKFFALAEGKEVVIEIDDRPTGNMRRYFEGAVVPAMYYQHPHSGWHDFRDCREAIKLEFLPGYVKSLKGKRTKYAKSTDSLSKKGFGQFLETLTRYFAENGLEIPDPESYKAWRDSAPPAGEIYPPLERMMLRYDEAKHERKKERKRGGE